MRTAEYPHSVAYAINKETLTAISPEVTRIEIAIVDNNDIEYPFANSELSFPLEGISLLGVDNGGPIDLIQYKRPFIKTFRGKCVLLVEAKENAGLASATILSPVIH